MIVITGAVGFIGSALVAKLNAEFYNDLVLVDDFSDQGKNKNIEGKTFTAKIDRSKLFPWLEQNHKFVQFIFHIGARTDTAEFDEELLWKLNFEYSRRLWEICVHYGLPMVYASSAATYGAGESGYSDSHDRIPTLKPLNPYGRSKNEFDKWALNQPKQPYFWAGLKFFNVYGPNEYHKGRMASVVFHTFMQVNRTGKMKLFRSHHPDYEDGAQQRDFVYVKDVLEVLFWLMHNRKREFQGIYNLGTGKAETFMKLAQSVFRALGKEPEIEFIDTPEDIRDKYQYFTEAEMKKLRGIGYRNPFTSLEDGVHDYVRNYLVGHGYL